MSKVRETLQNFTDYTHYEKGGVKHEYKKYVEVYSFYAYDETAIDVPIPSSVIDKSISILSITEFTPR